MSSWSKVFRRTRLHRHRFHRGFETLQLRDDRTVAGRHVRKPELAHFARDLDARLQTAHVSVSVTLAPARLTIWRWQRDGAGNGAGRGLRGRSHAKEARKRPSSRCASEPSCQRKGQGMGPDSLARRQAQSPCLLAITTVAGRWGLKRPGLTVRLCTFRSRATEGSVHRGGEGQSGCSLVQVGRVVVDVMGLAPCLQVTTGRRDERRSASSWRAAGRSRHHRRRRR